MPVDTIEELRQAINQEPAFNATHRRVLNKLVDYLEVGPSGIQSVVAGTSADIGTGDVSIAVDATDPANPVLNLTFTPA